MHIAVVQFPGSNCERETKLAVKRAGMQPVEFLWNEPCEKLTACDGFIIVGGFSYEDCSRAGVIAALDPIMAVIKQQSELGKPVLGICNGAQILEGLLCHWRRYLRFLWFLHYPGRNISYPLMAIALSSRLNNALCRLNR